jgi:hypothetical protein
MLESDEFLGFDISRTLEQVTTAKFDAKTARRIRTARNQLTQIRGRIDATMLRLNQETMVDPPEFILELRSLFPPDARKERRALGEVARYVRQAGVKNDLTKYREGVAAWTRVLLILGTVVGILTKWLEIGLEEWDSARERGRTPSQEPLKALARVRDWLNRNPGILSLSQITMQAFQFLLPPKHG